MSDEQKQFASDLQLMKNRAHKIGLHATAQRLDYPIRMVGFEMAGDIESCLKYEEALENAKP